MFGFYRYIEDRDHATCRARVEGRSDVRTVIIDIYDFIEMVGPDENIQQLRVRLDRVMPPLTMDQCLETI